MGTVCALLLSAGVVWAEGIWVDEISNALNFYQSSYPTSNFEPYVAIVDKMRDGAERGDGQIVKVEMDHFLKMLLARDHGINDVAADELYNLALAVRPAEGPGTAALDQDVIHERPMSVPDDFPQTRDDGRTPCVGQPKGGCDYWTDFMDDFTGG
jgi:hypothetical protein